MLQRVQKIIADSGLCSRRKAEDLIEEGRVRVNGVEITIGDKADPDIDKIVVDGQRIMKTDKVYYVLNKPKNYLCTSSDLYDRKTILDLLPKKKRIYSVGRLDRDATGLLLVTNDGEFANKITHPSHEIEKTYIAILDKRFDSRDIKKLKEGIRIDHQIVTGQILVLEKATIAITIHSGMNKVVKRLCKAMGYYIRQLHRTHVGGLTLDVSSGEYRELTSEEKTSIFTNISITKETFS